MSELQQDFDIMPIPLPGLTGNYSASSDGRIWSHLSNRFMKSSIRKDGYHYVVIRNNGRYVNHVVHRLICAAWHENTYNKKQVNHKNLVKTDNRSSNLEWVTVSENALHAWANLPKHKLDLLKQRSSLLAKAMNRKKRKLDKSQVDILREMVASGVSRTYAAAHIGLSRASVDRIINGETYRD